MEVNFNQLLYCCGNTERCFNLVYLYCKDIVKAFLSGYIKLFLHCIFFNMLGVL